MTERRECHGRKTGCKHRCRIDKEVTAAPQRWEARGGQFVLGKLLPALLVFIGLACVAGSIANLAANGRHNTFGSACLVVLGLVAATLGRRFYRTVWSVTFEDDGFTLTTSNCAWVVRPEEIVAVRGETSDQIILIVTTRRTVAVWTHVDDRASLMQAIKRANPAVRFAPWMT